MASACGVGVKARLRFGLVGGGVVGASACDSVVGARLWGGGVVGGGVVGESACGGVVGARLAVVGSGRRLAVVWSGRRLAVVW